MRESDLVGKPAGLKAGRPKEPRLPDRNMLADAPLPPCPRCNVRADVGCKHQPAAGQIPVALDPKRNKVKPDGRTKNGGEGRWAFHPPTREQVDSVSRSLFGSRTEPLAGDPDEA